MKRKIAAVFLAALLILAQFNVTALQLYADTVDETDGTEQSLQVGVEYSVNIENEGEEVLIPFTPEITEKYSFTSESDYDTYGTLYASDGTTVITSNDDSGEGANFLLEYVLEAETTYYFRIRFYNSSTTGSFNVILTKIHDYSSEIILEPTCTSSGSVQYKCNYCENSFIETIPGQHDYRNGYCSECGTREYNSGICGDSLTWTFDGANSTLIISGKGEMYDYNGSDMPWHDYKTRIKKAIFEEGVTSVGAYAFVDYTALRIIQLPSTLLTIEDMAFSNTGLIELLIPASVDILDTMSFSYCKCLKSVTMEEGVTLIAYGAFLDCTKLKNVNIPDSVVTIEGVAFAKSAITNLIIPKNVDFIDRGAFTGCSNLTEMKVDKLNTYYDSRDNCNAIIETATNTLIAGCKTTHIPDGVVTIGENAFERIEGLKSIAIPESVTVIDRAAFSDCYDLENIVLPAGLNDLGSYAFHQCYELKEITIPENVKTIKSYTFYDCNNLNKIILPNNLESIETYAFYNNLNLLNIEIPETINNVGESAFQGVPVVHLLADISNESLWGAKKIHDVPLAECTVCNTVSDIDAEEIQLDTWHSVKIEKPGTIKYFTYIPDTTEYYEYNARNYENDNVVYSYLYTGNMQNILSEDGDEYDSNICHTLYAGEKYYFVVKFLDENVTGEFDVSFVIKHKYDTTIIKEETCGEGGIARDICKYCNEVQEYEFFNYDDGKHEYLCEIISEGTCSSTGSRKYTCVKCKDSYTEITPERHQYDGNVCKLCGCEKYYTGSCGNNLVWKFYPNSKELNISGSGEMNNYDTYDVFPEWREYSSDIEKIIIEDGVTSIGSAAFADEWDSRYYPNLKEVTMTDSVLSIEERAFYRCANLEKVTLSNNITKIDIAAFFDCSILQTVELPDKLTYIGSSAFYGCSMLDDILLPEGLETIEGDAFRDCDALTTITIPSTVKSLGSYAFYGCDELQKLIVEDGLESIPGFAFYDCAKLSEIQIADSVNTFGVYAFAYCNLTELDLSENVISIEEGAFAGNNLDTITVNENNPIFDCRNNCNAVVETSTNTLVVGCKNTVIPNNVLIIGSNAFNGLKGIDTIVIPENVTTIKAGAFSESPDLKEITIPASVIEMKNGVFYQCENLESVIIKGNIEILSESTFYYCPSLKNVVLPTGLKIIENDAFMGCDLLETIILPESLLEIGRWAFDSCNGLKEIVFPSNLKLIEEYSFYGCNALKKIVFEGNAPQIEDYVFGDVVSEVYYPSDNPTWTEDVMQDYGGTLTWKPMAKELDSGYSGDTTWTLTDDGNITFTGEGNMKNYDSKESMPWYFYCDQITSVVIESGVERIGNNAFYGMPNLTSVIIPETVTSIGEYAFKNATALDNVVLPSGLTKLGESAFYACSSLKSIDIPASLWTVQPYTFKNCTALAEVTFHEGNLEKISDGAFYNTALKEVVLPDCLDILDSYVFKNCAKLEKITLSNSLTEIREASLYGTALQTITIPEGVTAIKPYAFKNCTALTNVVLANTLTAIDEAAFYACTGLTEIHIPDMVTTIGNYAFRKCTGLTSVNFGSGLKMIGESSFYGCSKITGLNIPEGVTSIGAYAFKACTGVTEVTLPESLITIGDSAFHTCTGFKAIVIPKNVETIGEYCFSGSWNLWQITFEGDAPAIGTGAFKGLEAIAYYPEGNTTWDSANMVNYGGELTWKAN